MTNVLYLHHWNQKEAVPEQPLQLELFADETKISGVAAYFDVAAHDQKELLSLMVRKAIRVVLDIRASKAFPRLRYDHARVFDYLSFHRISYADLEEELKEIRNSSVTTFWACQKLRLDQGRLDSLLKAGPCLVLYNSESDGNTLSNFRAVVSRPLVTVSSQTTAG
jgi:hypothetical protein